MNDWCFQRGMRSTRACKRRKHGVALELDVRHASIDGLIIASRLLATAIASGSRRHAGIEDSPRMQFVPLLVAVLGIYPRYLDAISVLIRQDHPRESMHAMSRARAMMRAPSSLPLYRPFSHYLIFTHLATTLAQYTTLHLITQPTSPSSPKFSQCAYYPS